MPDELPYKSRFLPLPVDVYDTGIDLILPSGTLRLYEHIRRFVQRRRRLDKKIYTDIRQTALAKRIGHNRQWVNKTVGLLEELGWLKRALIPNDNTGQKRYVLGYLNDANEEVFWADKRLEAYRRHVCKLTESKMEDFNKVAWDDRVGLLKQLLKPVLGPQKRPAKGRGVSSPQDMGVSSPQDKGCLAGETGGVFPARQGVSSPQDTLNRQVLKREFSKREFPNGSGEAFASPPASTFGSGAHVTTKTDDDFAAGPTDATIDATDPSPSSVAPLPEADEATAEDFEWSKTAEAEYQTLLLALSAVSDEPDGEQDFFEEDDVDDDDAAQTRRNRLVLGEGEAREKNKAAAAKNEEKRMRNTANRKRAAALGGKFLEKHIPKGSIAKTETLWRELFATHYPAFRPARWWTAHGDEGKLQPGKEAGQVSRLVQMFSLEQTEKYLRWAVQNWSKLPARWPKKVLPAVPSIGFLVAYCDELMPEALMLNQRDQVEAELRAWGRAHPDESPPPELTAKVKALTGKA